MTRPRRGALDSLRVAMEAHAKADRPHRTFTFGTVQSTGVNGCTVLLDGETVQGDKAYKWLGTSPVIGDRVMLAWVSRTYVILGVLHGT